MHVNVRLCDDCGRPVDQQRQEVEGLRREVHVHAVTQQLTAVGIENKRAETVRPPSIP